MKKLLLKLSGVFLIIFVSTLAVLNFFDLKSTNVKATTEEVTPKVEIYKNNVSYSDSIYIAYLLSYEGFEANDYDIQLLVWNSHKESYLKGNEDYLGISKGKTTIDGKKYLVFYSEGLAAKNMTDDLIARAYVKIEETEYYSEPFKFSVLEYAYKMKEESSLNPHQIRLLDALLSYGGAAQDNFDYNTDKKADATYYKITVNEGLLPDGFKHGRYQFNEKVIIKPLDKKGYKFSHWIDKNGIIVSYDKEFEITVTNKNEFTAIYKDITNVSTQLKMEYEVTYDTKADDLDLPNAVSITLDDQVYTHEIVWDLTKFKENQVGKQTLYASFVDETLYDEYNLTKEDIYVEINVLPWTYEIDQITGYYTITGYYGTDESVEIPSLYKNTFITKIAPKAFNEVLTLKEVIIPTTIEEIGLGSFYFCDNIESITIPFIGRSSKDYEEYGYSHFAYIFGAPNYEIQSVMLPYNLKSVTLNESLTHVGDYAFYDCGKLEEINMSESLEYIGQFSFENCTSLKEFYIGENFKTIANESFIGCSNLKKVYAHSLAVLLNVDIRGASAGGGYYSPLSHDAELYIDNELITEIEIPSYIKSLDGILTGCSSITKITVSKELEEMYWGCFANMKNLKTIVFEENSKLTELQPGTFYGCTSLEEINLPNSITTIGSNVFQNCTALKVIDISSINNYSLYSDNVFANCTSLEKVILSDDLLYIPDFTFDNCESLREITLPKGIVSIGMYAFRDCYNLNSIELPSKLREISDGAFDGCYNMYFIYNKSNLELTIGSTENGSVAYNAVQITDKNGNVITKENNEYIITDDKFLFEYSDEKYKLLAYLGDEETVTLPLSINECQYLINSPYGLKNVILPEGFTSINAYAFSGCSTIKSITIPSTVTSIGEYAFEYCECEIIWNNPTIETIESRTFAGYYGKSITIPSTVTSIEEYAFENCKCEIIWDNPTIETIGAYAFSNYQGKAILIPLTVTKIEEYAFNDCRNLTEIIISSNVTTIEYGVFQWCENLTIYYEGTEIPETWDPYWNSTDCTVVLGYSEEN